MNEELEKIKQRLSHLCLVDANLIDVLEELIDYISDMDTKNE